MKTLFNNDQLHITLQRLAHQLVENHLDFKDTVIIGIQPRGILLSDRIAELVKNITGNHKIDYGRLDITFYRDDVHKNEIQVPSYTDIQFSVEGKNVILVDDVLHTGRTIRAAMDALIDFGPSCQPFLSSLYALLYLDWRIDFSRIPVTPLSFNSKKMV